MHDTIDILSAKWHTLWAQATAIWLAGGWAMVGIAVIALVMFTLGLHVQLKLRGQGVQSGRGKTWRRWIDHPDEQRGPIGVLLEAAMASTSLADAAACFEAWRANEIAPVARDLRVMKICVSAATLLGLLGTVTGMLATFGALASGSGGEKTMKLVAEGISEALITTETGLVIALPGLFFHYRLVRKYERYKAFLAYVETVCTQNVYRKLRQQGREAPHETSS